MNRKLQLILVYLFLISPVIAGAQTTYFVSLSGDDTNDGLTEATAWRTISFSASSTSPVTGGDTIYIKAGDYGLDDVFIDKNYESGAARIFFIGYQNTPGDITEMTFSYGDDVDASVMPLINPNDRTIGEGINLSDIYSITIKNIQIANSIGGIYVWNTLPISSNHEFENIFIKTIGDDYSTAFGIKEANGNTIKNCLIVNATGAGMDLWGDHNLIENCKVYSDESELTEGGTYTSMDYYIVIKGNHNTIKNCYIERVGDLEDVGHGMEIKENGEQNLFVDCIAKNMIGGGFSVRWSQVKYNEFRNCKAIGTLEDITAFLIRDGASHNVFNSCVSEGCEAGVRFLLSGEDADYCGEYNTFNNCIIKDAKWAFDLNSWYYSSAPVDNNLFINGIIDHATNLFNCERPNSGNKIVNTIITNVDNFSIGDDPANYEYWSCDFFNNGFSMPEGNGNMEANPLFISATDYHLQTDSPCIDAGIALDAPDTDFEGNSRPQGMGYDIGAYEYTGQTATSEANIQKSILYPNPASDNIFITNTPENEKYRLFSSTGVMLKKGIINNHQINISNLPNGIYFINFTNSNRYQFIKNE